MSFLTRRDFVERSLASAAALAAGSLMTRSVHAQESSSGKSVGPNDKIRVAVIGVNGQGGAHVGEWLKNPDVDLVAIADLDEAAYAKQSQRFKDLKTPPKLYKDFRKLLENKDIDAVSIATPNHWHALMGVLAMQAGKDVYVEKPCSHNVQEGRVLVDWARKLGRICQMGAQSRSMPGMRGTIDFIHSGKLGKIKVAHAICYKRRKSIGLVNTPAPQPAGLDLDLWCGPAPLVAPVRERFHYDWHWVRDTGNGDVGNQNPHEIDKARWGLDKHEFPKRVSSLGGRLGYIDNGDVANSQITVFEWDDAILVSDVRGLELKTEPTFGLKGGPFNRASNVWYGTDGYAVSTAYNSGAAYDYDGHELGKWSGGSYQLHFANFVKGIRSRDFKDLHLDIEEGHQSSALSHLANVSYYRGKPVEQGTLPTVGSENELVSKILTDFNSHLAENKIDYNTTKLYLGQELTIDPKTELSTDAEANRLFSREYRQGYELPLVS